jgi:L-rhamnose mutarotase
MERTAYQIRPRARKEADNDQTHADIPADLDSALREARVRGRSIGRRGSELSHLVEVEDHEMTGRHVAVHPADIPRQGNFLDFEDDDSGHDVGISLVWNLP